MKEIRDYQLKVRLTQTERQQLFDYAAAHGMKISDVVRQALYRVLGGI